MNYKNHYKIGFTEVSHRGKTLATSLNAKSFDNFTISMNDMPYEVGYIPNGYEHRPDLISDLFYNTVSMDWLICMFNNIKDPFQELNVGDRILIPQI
tara:strand:- start:2635 stop:2925 length:291 start_codon:yes stop_codon:yes gene_type:complete